MTLAWVVHLYTASGAVLAFLAARDVFQYRFRSAFIWLAAALVVDATDGALARRANVAQHLPWLNGARIDDLVDYLTYVFVPALFVWRSLIVPAEWVNPVCAAMLISSAYGFSREDAKTADHFFTGFPSYWNIVVFYLLLAGLPTWVNAAILLTLAVLVFVPIHFVYPSRTVMFRRTTIALGSLWGGVMLVMLWRMPGVPRAWLWSSLAFPAYYVSLSIWLDARRRRNADPDIITP